MQKIRKSVAVVFMVMIMAALLVLSASAAVNDVIKDGSFESGDKAWKYTDNENEGTFLDLSGVKNKGVTIIKDKSKAHSGEQVVEFKNNARWAAVVQEVEVQKNKYYKLLYWTKMTSGRVHYYAIGMKDGKETGSRIVDNYGMQDGTNVLYQEGEGANAKYFWHQDVSPVISSGDFTTLRIRISGAYNDREFIETAGHLDDVQLLECDARGKIIGQADTTAPTTPPTAGITTTKPDSDVTTIAPVGSVTTADRTEITDTPGNTTSGGEVTNADDSNSTDETAGTRDNDQNADNKKNGGVPVGVIVAIIAVIVVAAGVAAFVIFKKKASPTGRVE